jgi:hypothetical protein
MGRDLFNELPLETRLQIFRLATIKPSQAEDTRAEYRPFDPVALRDRDWSNSNQTALSVKATIVLVCKEWKSIATEMLYECIRIQHGTHNLLSALESTRYSSPDVTSGVEFEYEYGRWVRRVEISPAIMDFDPFNPYPLLRILQCCPFVQTIVRSSTVLGSGGIALGFVRLPPGTVFPSFPSVRRIDWWLSSLASFGRTSSNSVYGFLGELVAHSPGLDYLTLSGCGDGLFVSNVSADPFGSSCIPFKSLTTLRLEDENIDLKPSLLLPNLSRLIVGMVFGGTKKILSTFGHQIRVLEFIVTHSRPMTFDIRRMNPLASIDILKACPNLEELNARLSTGDILFQEAVKTGVPIPLHSLRSIRIHLDDSPLLTAISFGHFIRQYLLCPALESIVLCGGTRQAWEENPVFPILEKHISGTRFLSLEFQES